MRTGTRRMWSRRFLRAGWMIAPIFSFPAAICGSFKRNWSTIKFILILFSLMAGFLTMLFYGEAQSRKKWEDAPVAKVKSAAANPCIAQQIAHELSQGVTVSHYDLEVFDKRCADAMVVRAQLEAIK